MKKLLSGILLLLLLCGTSLAAQSTGLGVLGTFETISGMNSALGTFETTSAHNSDIATKVHTATIESTGGGSIDGTLGLGAINITSTATVAGESKFGYVNASLEGYSQQRVIVYNRDIASADTDAIIFNFIPSKIVFTYFMGLQHLTTTEEGHTTGHTIINIVSGNTFTATTDYVFSYWNAQRAPFGRPEVGSNQLTDTVLKGYCGIDNTGNGPGALYALVNDCTWNSSTRTFTIKWTSEASVSATVSEVHILATAYR